MIAIMLALGVFSLPVKAQRVSLKIPPVKTSVEIENQPVTITASANISQVWAPRGQNAFQLDLLADLSDVQHNITMILSWFHSCTSNAGSASGCSARSGATS